MLCSHGPKGQILNLHCLLNVLVIHSQPQQLDGPNLSRLAPSLSKYTADHADTYLSCSCPREQKVCHPHRITHFTYITYIWICCCSQNVVSKRRERWENKSMRTRTQTFKSVSALTQQLPCDVGLRRYEYRWIHSEFTASITCGSLHPGSSVS